MDRLEFWIKDYFSNVEENNYIHNRFTILTNNMPFLKEHRDWVEKNKWGFGDRAFHYMWFLIIKHLSQIVKKAKVLEIGVYKGQIISLWSLISKEIDFDLDIVALSPFQGKREKSLFRHVLKKIFIKEYRISIAEGNLYDRNDYLALCRKIFESFKLNFDKIEILKGFSTQSEIISLASRYEYDVIYIDGDHSYEGVISDITNYSSFVKKGGFLVMDDASYYLPGTEFFKGHEAVSRACEIIPNLGFKNILNIGHNRLFMRI